jgi:hypothetical protein
MSARRRASGRQYDLALSFAGQDRALVQEVAEFLELCGARIFYDDWERHRLVGINLYEYLDDLYQNRARYCVVFISKSYVRKAWPRLELRAAQARAFSSASAYILPVHLDSTPCPGIPKTVGYLPAKRSQASQIAVTLLRKLGRNLRRGDVEQYQFERKMRWEVFWNGSVRARAKCRFVYLGRNEKKQLGFNVWSADGRPLQIANLWAKDSRGPLKVDITARSDTSVQCKITLRASLRPGESVAYSMGYTCDEYYSDISTLCRDDFSISLPTRLWEYEFVFPKGSTLSVFRLTRRTGKVRVREFHTLAMEKHRPVVQFSCLSPRVGSRLDVEFKLRR